MKKLKKDFKKREQKTKALNRCSIERAESIELLALFRARRIVFRAHEEQRIETFTGLFLVLSNRNCTVSSTRVSSQVVVRIFEPKKLANPRRSIEQF